MKIDRLIGILSILLQQEQVTAPYLAEKFEVSRRTINRDVEALCKAGIPIVTTQGKNGGISIMDGYRMDRMLGLEMLNCHFAPRNPQPYQIQPEKAFEPRLDVKVMFQPSARWRLIEEYGTESFEEQEDGRLLFSFSFTDKEHLFGWLLAFGERAELLEPASLREELRALALRIAETYET